jgi:hypothetical protein
MDDLPIEERIRVIHPQMEADLAQKPKRKYKRHKKLGRPALRIVPPSPQPRTGRYAGISPALCCEGCKAEACVISGDICVHPYKGGL